MAYIFMDESGDLGFDRNKKGSSKNFLITFFVCENPSPFEKIVKKTFLAMPEDKKKKHCGTLHACHEHPKTKMTMLSLLKNKGGFSIMVIRVNKSKVFTKLQNTKNVLYNYATNILLDRIINKKLCDISQGINFIASQKDTNKYLNRQFTEYLESQIQDGININLRIKSSSSQKCLQIADFISWSIYQKYEHGDESYYETIKDFIVEDNSLYK